MGFLRLFHQSPLGPQIPDKDWDSASKNLKEYVSVMKKKHFFFDLCYIKLKTLLNKTGVIFIKITNFYIIIAESLLIIYFISKYILSAFDEKVCTPTMLSEVKDFVE